MRRLREARPVSLSHPPVVELTAHCTALSKLLHALAYQHPEIAAEEGETYGWSQPAEWLDLAASVVKVDVVTAQDDISLAYCGSALEYENDRNRLLSQLATAITIFSFVWGAFESVTKIVKPPSIPKPERKDGNDKPVARVIHALRPLKPDGVYHCRLAQIRDLMAALPAYRESLPVDLVPVTAAEAGEGIDLVRRIRNKFAHGAAALPQRDDWNGKDTLDNRLVRLSCRTVLLTIQMMLRVHFAGQSFDVELYECDTVGDCEHEIHSHLETLHLVSEQNATEDDEPDQGEATDPPGEAV